MRDIIVRNFIEVHKDPNHCARWDSDLTETGVSGVEGMAFRIANGYDAPKGRTGLGCSTF